MDLSFEELRSIQFEQINYLIIHREFFKDLLSDPAMVNRSDGIFTLRTLSERNTILILSILIGNKEHYSLGILIASAKFKDPEFKLFKEFSDRNKRITKRYQELKINEIRNQHIAHIDNDRLKINLPYMELIDLINEIEIFFIDFNLEFDGLLFSSFLHPNSLKTLRMNFDTIREIENEIYQNDHNKILKEPYLNDNQLIERIRQLIKDSKKG